MFSVIALVFENIKLLFVFLNIYLVKPLKEKAMAPHSSPLAWKIPWTEEPGRVAKSWTWLSDFTFTLHFHALEKEMATHSSVLAWRIPGMWSHRVGHD